MLTIIYIYIFGRFSYKYASSELHTPLGGLHTFLGATYTFWVSYIPVSYIFGYNYMHLWVQYP